MVLMFLFLLNAAILLLFILAGFFKGGVLTFKVLVIEKCAKKICIIIYIRRMPTYNVRSKMKVLVTVRTYFCTD